MSAMIEPLTMAGVRVTLGGRSAGFPAGGMAKVGGRTLAMRADARVLAVKRG